MSPQIERRLRIIQRLMIVIVCCTTITIVCQVLVIAIKVGWIHR